jgi:hypothetical protein
MHFPGRKLPFRLCHELEFPLASAGACCNGPQVGPIAAWLRSQLYDLSVTKTTFHIHLAIFGDVRQVTLE